MLKCRSVQQLPGAVSPALQAGEGANPKPSSNFMQDLLRDSWQRYPDERMRTYTTDYFAMRGYGQNYYLEADIRQIVAELNAVGSLWSEDDSMKLIKQHSRWRGRYHRYRFK